MAESVDVARLGPPDWALDELADYIVDRHHRYVHGAIPALRASLAAAAGGWGATHAPVMVVQALFDELADELESHMAKEEHLLFPAIRDLARAKRSQLSSSPAPFATLMHPIRVMEDDHSRASNLLGEIRRETDGYRAPAAAGADGQDCYRQLAAFDEDLQTHIHLENDLLFPRALELERQTA